MMKFVSVICVMLVGIAHGQDKYPAGLSPAVCPNYPLCDNTIVALHNPPSAPIVARAADGYPAGISPAACPNYPYCGSAAPEGYFVRRYPAGISPASCPNYPYCY